MTSKFPKEVFDLHFEEGKEYFKKHVKNTLHLCDVKLKNEEVVDKLVDKTLNKLKDEIEDKVLDEIERFVKSKIRKIRKFFRKIF